MADFDTKSDIAVMGAREVAMVSLISKRCRKVAGGWVKTLTLPDGRCENRTCKGGRDTEGRSVGIHSSLA